MIPEYIHLKLAFLGVIVLYCFITKKLDGFITHHHEKVHAENNNMAFAMVRASLYIAVVYSLLALVPKEVKPEGFNEGILTMIKCGAAVVGLLLFTRVIADKVILSHVDNRGEISKGNLAVGVVESAILFSSGFILNSGFLGEGTVWAGIIFCSSGLVAFSILSLCCREHVKSAEKGELDSAIFLATRYIVFGIILSKAVGGNFEGYLVGFKGFALAIFTTMVFLGVFGYIARKFFGYSEKEILESAVPAKTLAFGGFEVAIALAVTMLF